MNAEVLLKHFDRVSDAPETVPRLRQFVWDLAVRGKLVDQNSSDEPASRILERMATEATGCKSSKLMSAQHVNVVPSREMPFEIPASWIWTRLGAIGEWGSGSTPSRAHPELYGGGIPWLKSGELNDNRELSGSEETVTQAAVDSGSFRQNKKGDVLIAMYGATIGKVAILTEPAVTNQAVCGCTPFRGLYNHFLFYFLVSQRSYFRGASEGGAQPNISKQKILGFPIPLPPELEQYRIVEKLDELMALCDRLEEVQNTRNSGQARLATATLQNLHSDTDEDTVRENARFFIKNLPKLTVHPHQIEELRQTILHLAVRGRLLPQSREEEPAPFFGITGEAGEGRLDFTIPPGWNWARVADVADARLGKMLDKAKNSGRPVRYLRNTNVHWFDIRMDELKELKIENTEIEKYCLRPGDVLICEGGHGIGRTAVWQKNDTDIVFQKALHRVRPQAALNSDFFVYCMFVYYHAGILEDYFTGVGIPHFTGQALAKLIFPLPPIAEQRRIVAKVKELLTLCEQLETNLAVIQAESHNLLDSVLYGAISSEAQ